MDVGTGNSAVQDVAANGDRQAVNASHATSDRQRVEQRLRRVFMRAVSGIDHRAINLLRKKLPHPSPRGARSARPDASR